MNGLESSNMEKVVLKKGIQDLKSDYEIDSLFDAADQFRILNRLIAIEQRMDKLVEFAAMSAREKERFIVR